MSPDDPKANCDSRPLPPREPEPDECCGSGCEPCVYDRYYEALDRYEAAIQAWLQHHPEALADQAPDAKK